MLLTDRLQELSSKATGVNVKIPAAMLRQIYVNTERQHDKQRPSYTCGPFLLLPLLLRTCTHVIYFHTQSMNMCADTRLRHLLRLCQRPTSTAVC